MKKIYVIVIFVLSTTMLDAQFESRWFTSDPVADDSSKYNFYIRAAGFFHNNEFFSTDEEGYTLIGNFLQPAFRLRLNNELSLTAGIHMLKYHGQNGFNQAEPLFNISYSFSPGGNLLIGSYNGGDRLGLPEELYARELEFTRQLMNGILIDYSASGFTTRTWLDWESFIERGDPFREVFTFGFAGSYDFISDENKSFRIPLFFLVNHKGGQINNSNLPVETIADLSSGIIFETSLDNRLFPKVSFRGMGFLENDVVNDEDGFALLGQVEGKNELLALAAGYFYGNHWESIHGNPLLFSGDANTVNHKNMILLKAGIGKVLGSGNSISLRFEGYYDIGIKKFQYTYGIYLVVNESLWRGGRQVR